MLIGFEGLPGSGKTTVVARLAEKLRKLLPERDIVECKFPSDGIVGTFIQQLNTQKVSLPIQAVCDLCAADSAENAPHIVEKLQKGAIVLLDRVEPVSSHVAYSAVLPIFSLAHSYASFPSPDLIFFLDVDLSVIQARFPDAETIPSTDTLNLLRNKYLGIAFLDSRRWVSIPLKTESPDDVAEIVLRSICQVLGITTETKPEPSCESNPGPN